MKPYESDNCTEQCGAQIAPMVEPSCPVVSRFDRSLVLFPQPRGAGIWLFGVPASFVTILLSLSVAKKIIDFLIVYWLRRWGEQDSFSCIAVAISCRRAESHQALLRKNIFVLLQFATAIPQRKE